jgi:hypothetical protein
MPESNPECTQSSCFMFQWNRVFCGVEGQTETCSALIRGIQQQNNKKRRSFSASKTTFSLTFVVTGPSSDIISGP